MAGQLVQVDSQTITSATSSLYLSGITTDDVYMVTVNNLFVTTDNTSLNIRVGSGGSADTTSNYDGAQKTLYTAGSFIDNSYTNGTNFVGLNNLDQSGSGGATPGSNANAIYYLYNWNNASEYSFITQEEATMLYITALYGHQGGGVHTVNQSNSEIHFVMSSSTIASGVFSLYRVV
jgi:hypothetical protein